MLAEMIIKLDLNMALGNTRFSDVSKPYSHICSHKYAPQHQAHISPTLNAPLDDSGGVRFFNQIIVPDVAHWHTVLPKLNNLFGNLYFT